jgi:hypothetical protein
MQNKISKTNVSYPSSFLNKSYLTAASTIIQGWKARSYKGLQRMTQTVEGAKQLIAHVTWTSVDQNFIGAPGRKTCQIAR